MVDARVTVVIADDHPVYRHGLSRAIRDRAALDLIGEASDGRAALTAIEQLEPGVAVLDIGMPGLDGIQVLKALRRDHRATAVLLLSGSAEVESLYDAIAAGATGYLLKTAEHEAICDAICAVARGATVFSAELNDSLALDIRGRARESKPLLSPRELEVLRMTASGSGAAAIAQELFLSVATVRTHIQNGYQKLDVSDRAAAVATAMRLGLIE